MLRAAFLALALAGLGPAAPAEEAFFKQGEELFMQNKPREALPLFEAALQKEPRNERLYLYLGAAYEQLKNGEKAIGVLKRGLEVALAYKDLMLFNLGNNYAAKGDLAAAAAMYTEAVGANGSLADAYLNRANVRVKLETYKEAVDDYRIYLNLAPDSAQRGQIERMIALLTKAQEDQERKRLEAELRKKEEEERRKLGEEQRKKEEEERRIAEEKRRRDEEARQKALLDSILNSLQTSSGGTQNLKAEGEGIQEVKPQSDIED